MIHNIHIYADHCKCERSSSCFAFFVCLFFIILFISHDMYQDIGLFLYLYDLFFLFWGRKSRAVISLNRTVHICHQPISKRYIPTFTFKDAFIIHDFKFAPNETFPNFLLKYDGLKLRELRLLLLLRYPTSSSNQI